MASVKLLIVEDEAIVAKHIENSLKSLGYGVVGIARSGEQALQKAGQTSPDLVLMDIHLKGDMDGVAAAERIRSQFDIPVVYLTAYADDRTVERAKLTEPFGYIFKPFNSRDLRVTIEIALYRHQMEQKMRENEALTRALLNAPTDRVIIVDADRNVLDVNRTVADGMSQPREALIGRGLSELFPPDLLQSRAAHMERVLRSGEPARFEVEHQGVWFDTILYPILDAEGQVAKVAVFSRDITERVQAQAHREAALEALRIKDSAIESSINAVALSDMEGNLTYVNDAFLKLWGYDERQQVLGRPALEFWDAREGAAAVVDALHTRGGWVGELVAKRQDGSSCPVQLSASLVTDEAGNPICLMASFLDISERVQAAAEKEAALQALRESRERLATTLQSIGDGVIATDAQGMITLMNPVAQALTGWTETDAVGRPLTAVFQIVDGQTGEPVKNPAIRALREGNIGGLDANTVLIGRDGIHRPVTDSGAPIFDAQGTITGAVLVFRDQTEERLTRRFMETRLSLIEYAANHTLDELLPRALDEVGAFVDSPIGFYHFVAPDQKTLSLQQWSSRTLEEFCQAEGKGLHYGIDQAGVWVDCVHEKKPVIHNDYAALPHKKGMPAGHAEVTRELVVPVMRNGQVVAILGVGNKPTEYTHKDAEIVSYLADVTWEIVKQKRSDEALQRYALELEQRSQETKQFVYIVSHDLRTPLFNLKGFANILSDAMEVMEPVVEAALIDLDESQRQAVTRAWQEDVPEALEFIQASVAKMDHFIQAILKLSRLGRHQLELEPIDMEALVQGTLDTLAHKIQDREVQVTVDPLPEVVADWLSMEQIMGNLLSNAVLYLDPNRPGQIEISGERRPDETLFYVRDNGLGIAQEDAAEVFVPFRRVGGQAVPGEGMGLAYVRTLVQRHQGRIWFESELGAGTVFVFSISNHLEQNSLDG